MFRDRTLSSSAPHSLRLVELCGERGQGDSEGEGRGGGGEQMNRRYKRITESEGVTESERVRQRSTWYAQ